LASSCGAAVACAGKRPLSSSHAGCQWSRSRRVDRRAEELAPVNACWTLARWLLVEAGYHQGCGGGGRRGNNGVNPLHQTQLLSPRSPSGALVCRCMALEGLQAAYHDDSVAQAPLEGGTWLCMRHGARAEPHAYESWTAMHCQAGTVPVSAPVGSAGLAGLKATTTVTLRKVLSYKLSLPDMSLWDLCLG